MLNHPILLPMLAMVALTFSVWVRLYVVRIREMRARSIHPQAVASSRERAGAFEDTRASDNFVNLFEVPMLFHVFCLVLLVAQATGIWFVYGAWLYVALRVVHSVIQSTYNKVMHRFMVYVASTLLLGALWVAFALRVTGSWPELA